MPRVLLLAADADVLATSAGVLAAEGCCWSLVAATAGGPAAVWSLSAADPVSALDNPVLVLVLLVLGLLVKTAGLPMIAVCTAEDLGFGWLPFVCGVVSAAGAGALTTGTTSFTGCTGPAYAAV